MWLSALVMVKGEESAGQSVTGSQPLNKMLVTEVAVLLKAADLDNQTHWVHCPRTGTWENVVVSFKKNIYFMCVVF